MISQADSVGRDIVDMLAASRTKRAGFERVWRDVSEFMLPNAPMNLLNGDWGTIAHRAPAGVADIYDTTPIWTMRRLANGIISLLMPSTQYWHGLKVGYRFDEEVPQYEKEYLEKLRNFMFQVRNLPHSGFNQANQAAVRQMLAFGTALYMVHENKANFQQPFRYQYLPLGHTYIEVNSENVVDRCIIEKYYTAKQAAHAFGIERLSSSVRKELDNPGSTQVFTFLLCIKKRQERGSMSAGSTVRNSEFAYYVVEEATQKTVKESGFFEFPIVRYVWDEEPGCAYGISPVMLLMPTIKNTNVMGQALLLGSQSAAAPAFATPANGVGGVQPLDLRPHASNPGMLNNQGNMLVQPIQQTGNINWVADHQQREQQNIKEGLFMNLFQVLEDNPNDTATASLIKEQEKGELLGPVGHSIHSGANTLIDREVGILDRQGAFDEGSPLEMPESLMGQEFGPEYTSPLDKARKSNQALGIQRTLEVAKGMAEAKPEVLVNIDFDSSLRTMGDILGAPKTVFKTEEERDEELAKAQQMQEAQQMAAMAQQAGDAAQSGANAVTAGADAVNAAQGSIPAGQELMDLMNAQAEGNA